MESDGVSLCESARLAVENQQISHVTPVPGGTTSRPRHLSTGRWASSLRCDCFTGAVALSLDAPCVCPGADGTGEVDLGVSRAVGRAGKAGRSWLGVTGVRHLGDTPLSKLLPPLIGDLSVSLYLNHSPIRQFVCKFIFCSDYQPLGIREISSAN